MVFIWGPMILNRVLSALLTIGSHFSHLINVLMQTLASFVSRSSFETALVGILEKKNKEQRNEHDKINMYEEKKW